MSRKRKVILTLSIVAGVVALFAIRELWIAAFARPVITVDSVRLLTELTERSQPPGENGWEAATTLCGEYTRESELLEPDPASTPEEADAFWLTTDFRAILVGDPLRPELARTRAMVRTLDSDAMKRLEVAERFTGSLVPENPQPVANGDVMSTLNVFERFTLLIKLQQSRLAAMRLSVIARDRDGYMAALRQALRLSRSVVAPPVAMSYLMARHMVGLTCDEIRHELVEGSLPPEWAGEVDSTLSESYWLPRVEDALEGEKIFALDYVQRMHTTSGFAGGRLLRTEAVRVEGNDPWDDHSVEELFDGIDDPPLHWTANFRSLWLPSRSRTESDLTSLFSALIADASKPRGERIFDTTEFDRALPERSGLRVGAFGSLAESMKRLLQQSDAAATTFAATRLLIAIELYRADHGEYPASLAELSIKPLPVDPFAADGLFYYQRLATPDANGRLILLCSVGADGVDNGGAPPHSGEMFEAFLSEASGSDWIANSPRPPPETPNPNLK